jgi:hypothetical protein
MAKDILEQRRWLFLLVVAIMLLFNLMVWPNALKKPIDLPVKVEDITV